MTRKLKEKCAELLRKSRINKTKPRINVLSILMTAKRPMNQKQILTKISGEADKVTIYRTLESFINKGIVHKAYLQERIWHYELSDRCTEKQCHPHFTCKRCGDTRCMPEIILPLAKSPVKGFEITHQQVKLEGLCPQCTEK